MENVSVYDPCCYHIHCAYINVGTFRNIMVTDPVYLARVSQ